MDTAHDWMTLREAANLLGTNVLSVLDAIEAGTLPGYSCTTNGRPEVIRVRRCDVSALLEPTAIEPGTLLAAYPDADFPEVSQVDVMASVVEASTNLRRFRRLLPLLFVAFGLLPLVTLAAAGPSWIDPDRPRTVLLPIMLLAVPSTIPLAGLTVAVLSFARSQWSALSRTLGASGIATLLAGGVATIVGYFAFFYWMLSQYRPEAFTEPLDKVDAVYFAVTIFSTTGFGDIAAQEAPARLLVTAQMAYGFAVVSVVVALVVSRGFVSDDTTPG